MNALLPWPGMFGLIEPICPKTGNGRHPCPLGTMLRIQQWYNPSDAVNQWFFKAGIMMKQGTQVDATIIEAPGSTKNKRGERDPEIHQTTKGNQWYVGMKAHIGVDTKSGLTHSLETTSRR